MDNIIEIANYSKMISNHPNDYQLYKKRAYLYAKIKDYESAIFDMRKASSIKKSEPAFCFTTARWLIMIGDFEEALGCLNNTIQLESKLSELYYTDSCHFLSSIAYLQLKDYEKSNESILKVRSDSRIHILGKLYTRENIMELTK